MHYRLFKVFLLSLTLAISLAMTITACSDVSITQPKAAKSNLTHTKSVDEKNYYYAAMATENIEDLLILVNKLNSLGGRLIDNHIVIKLMSKYLKMSDTEKVVMLRLLNGKINHLHLDGLKPMLLSKNIKVAEEAYLLLLSLPVDKATRPLHSLVMVKTNSSFIRSKAKSILTS
jgi:hypothetical protein